MRVSEEEKKKSRVVYETECRYVAVQREKQARTMYSTETHTSDFILNTVLKWEASAVFPGEVLSSGDGVPRERVGLAKF